MLLFLYATVLLTCYCLPHSYHFYEQPSPSFFHLLIYNNISLYIFLIIQPGLITTTCCCALFLMFMLLACVFLHITCMEFICSDVVVTFSFLHPLFSLLLRASSPQTFYCHTMQHMCLSAHHVCCLVVVYSSS